MNIFKNSNQVMSQFLSNNFIKVWLRKLKNYTSHHLRLSQIMNDLLLQQIIAERTATHLNSMVRYGKKCFSQMDEDGITLEIIRRLGLEKGTYIELGVGDGLENNTLILASLGWQGFWVGAEELAFNYQESKKFRYFQQWISLENILTTIDEGLSYFNQKKPQVISLDLDGNDWYFVEAILNHTIHPDLFIVEYNAKFPPPVQFCIDYNPNHFWQGDDYFGASLSSFVNLFKHFDYSLICCNAATGANAFFVKTERLHLFPEVPDDINKIYSPPQYQLLNYFGHPPGPKVIEKILS
jgi:hypothetical protein